MHLSKDVFKQKKLSRFPTFIYKGKQRKISLIKLLRIESIPHTTGRQKKRCRKKLLRTENMRHNSKLHLQ